MLMLIVRTGYRAFCIIDGHGVCPAPVGNFEPFGRLSTDCANDCRDLTPIIPGWKRRELRIARITRIEEKRTGRATDHADYAD